MEKTAPEGAVACKRIPQGFLRVLFWMNFFASFPSRRQGPNRLFHLPHFVLELAGIGHLPGGLRRVPGTRRQPRRQSSTHQVLAPCSGGQGVSSCSQGGWCARRESLATSSAGEWADAGMGAIRYRGAISDCPSDVSPAATAPEVSMHQVIVPC